MGSQLGNGTGSAVEMMDAPDIQGKNHGKFKQKYKWGTKKECGTCLKEIM